MCAMRSRSACRCALNLSAASASNCFFCATAYSRRAVMCRNEASTPSTAATTKVSVQSAAIRVSPWWAMAIDAPPNTQRTPVSTVAEMTSGATTAAMNGNATNHAKLGPAVPPVSADRRVIAMADPPPASNATPTCHTDGAHLVSPAETKSSAIHAVRIHPASPLFRAASDRSGSSVNQNTRITAAAANRDTERAARTCSESMSAFRS